MAAESTPTTPTMASQLEAGNLGAVGESLLANPLLLHLRDIHPPTLVPWWPPAPGWWMLLGLVLMLTLALGIRWLRQHRARQYQREAKWALLQNYRRWQTDRDTGSYLTRNNIVLRRLALTVLPRAAVAPVTGHRWAALLNSLSAKPLSANCRHALSQACYQSVPQADVDQVHRELIDWLAQHRGPPSHA